MPRKARVVLPNYPHHVVQRGHNRRAVFIEETDYLHYLENLAEWKTTLGCKVYGYCLMTNHVLCGVPHNKCNVKFRIM